MTTTLRDFLAQRDTEIKEQIKLLRAEQKELQVARAALDGQDPPQSDGGPTSTIKDMARWVLLDAVGGLTSGEILAAIKLEFGRDIDRTSLSPQLSRLKEAGELVLNGERWFTKRHHDVYQQKIAEMFDDDGGNNEIEVIRAEHHDL